MHGVPSTTPTGGGDLFEDLKRNNGQMKEKYAVRDVIVPFLNALQYLHGKVRHWTVPWPVML
jgi:hypothetical protein